MNRRELLVVVGGAFLPTSPSAQPTAVRRIGWVEAFRERGPPATDNWSAVAEQLKPLGWTRGLNLRADLHIPTTREHLARSAVEVVEGRPDLIVTNGTSATLALLPKHGRIPLLFFEVSDPIANGIVRSLSHPESEVTGFIAYEPSVAGKWLQLLTEVDPSIRRAAVLLNPDTTPTHAAPFLEELNRAASAVAVTTAAAFAYERSDIERIIAGLVGEPKSALLVLPDDFTLAYRHTIVAVTARYKVPAIFATRFSVTTGGLMAYGPSAQGLHRDLAGYIDRLLRGRKAGDLPVQAPSRYELVLNARAARDLGLTLPGSLLAIADEVIE